MQVTVYDMESLNIRQVIVRFADRFNASYLESAALCVLQEHAAERPHIQQISAARSETLQGLEDEHLLALLPLGGSLVLPAADFFERSPCQHPFVIQRIQVALGRRIQCEQDAASGALRNLKIALLPDDG